MRRTTVEVTEQKCGGDSTSAPMVAELWVLKDERLGATTPIQSAGALARSLWINPRTLPALRLATCNSGAPQR